MSEKRTSREFQLDDLIAKGEFGSVYRVVDTAADEVRVIKKISTQDGDIIPSIQDRLDDSSRAYLFGKIRFKYVVQNYDYFFEVDNLYILKEYYQNGDLGKFIAKQKFKNELIKDELVLKWSIDLAETLCFLKKQNIIHNRIKPGNILISDDGKSLLLNELLEIVLFDEDVFERTKDADWQYKAPELLASDAQPSHASDAWAAGVVIYQLAYLDLPCKSISEVKNPKQSIIFGGGALAVKLKPILEKIFQLKPKKRPDSVDILHFLQNLSNNDYDITKALDAPENDYLKLAKVPPRPTRLVPRESVLKDIETGLNYNNQMVILQGPKGLGKTTTAIQYAYDQLDTKHNQVIVRWFNASYKDLIERVYYTTFADYFKIPRIGISQKSLVEAVNKSLTSLNTHFLFVFDNLRDISDIEIFIKDLNLRKFKILATANDDVDFGSVENLKVIRLPYFTESESIELLQLSSAKKVPEQNAKEFYSYLAEKNTSGVLPLTVKVAASIYNSNNSIKVDNIDASAETEGDSQDYLSQAVNFQIRSLDKQSIGYRLLPYLAYLDGDFVSFDLRDDIIKSDASISDNLGELSKKVLVELKLDDEIENSGINVHESIQDVIRTRNTQPADSLVNDLIKKVEFKAPLLNENYSLEKALEFEKIHLQALKMVSYDNKELQSDKVGILNRKLAHYNKNRLFNKEGFLRYSLKAYEEFTRIYGNEDRVDVAETLADIALGYFWQGKSAEAIAYYVKAIDMFRRVYRDDDHTAAVLYNDLGLCYQQQKNYDKALESFHKANDIIKTKYPQNHPELATFGNNIGNAYRLSGNHLKSLQYYLKVYNMLKEDMAPNTADYALLLNNIGLTYNSLGLFDESLEFHLDALQMRRELFDEKSPEVGESLMNIGNTYLRRNEPSKALDFYTKSLDIFTTIYPDPHIKTAYVLTNIGIAHSMLEEPDVAVEKNLQALEMFQNLHKGNHADTARSLNNTGKCYYQTGDTSKALEYLNKALDMRNELYDGVHPDVATSLNDIGNVYFSLNDIRKAKEYFVKAIEVKKQSYPASHQEVRNSLVELAKVYAKTGELDKAVDCLTEELQMRKEVFGEASVEVADAYLEIGKTYESFKQNEKALEYYLKSLETQKLSHTTVFHPDLLPSLQCLTDIYVKLEDKQKELEARIIVLDIRKAIYEKNHPDIEKSLFEIGLYYLQQGNPQKSLEYLREANKMCRALDDRHQLANCICVMGAAYELQGDYQKGLNYKQKAYKMLKEELKTDNHVDLAIALEYLAKSYRRIDDNENALDCYTKALNVYANIFEDRDRAEVANIYVNMGTIYDSYSDFPSAIENYAKAMDIYQHLYPDEEPNRSVAILYNNLGLAYMKSRDYEKALENCMKGLKMRRKLLETKPDNISRQTDLNESLASVSLIYLMLNDPKSAIKYQLEEEQVREKMGRNDFDYARLLKNLAMNYDQMHNNEKCLEYHLKSIDLYEKLLSGSINDGKDKANKMELVNSYNMIAKVYDESGKYHCSIDYYNKAISLLQSVDPDNLTLKGVLYMQLGFTYHKIGRFPQALENLEKSIEINTQSGNELNLADSQMCLGVVYSVIGDPAKTYEYLFKSLDSKNSFVASDTTSKSIKDTSLATAYSNIGYSYDKFANTPKALSYYQKTLETLKSMNLEDKLPMIKCLNNLGDMHLLNNDPTRALDFYNEAMDTEKYVFSNSVMNQRCTADSLMGIGNANKLLGDSELAYKNLKKSLEVRKSVLPSNHPDIAKSYMNLGLAYVKFGELNNGLKNYTKAYEIYENFYEQNHPEKAKCLNYIANLYILLNDNTRALETYKKAWKLLNEFYKGNHHLKLETLMAIAGVYSKQGNAQSETYYSNLATTMKQEMIQGIF